MEKQRDKAAKRAQRKLARQETPEGERDENDDLLYLVDGELVEDPEGTPNDDDE
jgi:hypothetical protein